MVDGVPGYVRLAAMLRDKIRSGELPVGSFTPSQHELETGLGISRGMAGEALKLLAYEGLVRSRRGVGTQVIAVPEELPRVEVGPGVEITARMPRPGEDADPAVPLLVIARPGEPDEVHPAGQVVIVTVAFAG